MKLVEDERNTWTYAHKNASNFSDQEILETLEKGYNLKEKQLELERDLMRAAGKTHDYREGVKAFLEKYCMAFQRT